MISEEQKKELIETAIEKSITSVGTGSRTMK
jgi:hypothetical protein